MYTFLSENEEIELHTNININYRHARFNGLMPCNVLERDLISERTKYLQQVK